jgi:hypothetical protein
MASDRTANMSVSHPLWLMEKAVASIRTTDATAKKSERDLLIISPPLYRTYVCRFIVETKHIFLRF